MADRYWRGGTGTWDATSTTNWSATSGGAGGASAPTGADDVFFNSASNATAYTVTINTGAACRSVTIAGPASGNVTVAGSGAWDVSGSMTLPATGMTRTYTGTITFQSNTTRTITTNGVSLGGNLVFDRSNGIWSLGSALTTTGSVTVTNGTFNTANFALTASALLSTNSNTRSISLGSSTVTLSAIRALDFTTSTGLTFNAGTSTINCTQFLQLEFYAGSGQTFYNVNGTGTAGNTYTDIQGANTFNNLSLTGQTTGRRLTFNANTTINGTFTVTGGTNIGGMWSIRPADFTTNRTITAAAVSLTDVQFYNITGAGAASWTGTRLGNAGLNSNITFPAPKTVYWSLLTGGNITGTGWATTSNGTPAAANYPLCQDTGVIDDAGINAAATLTWNVTAQVFGGGLNFSALTKNITFSSNQNPILANCTWTFDNNVTTSGTQTINMYGAATVNANGTTLTNATNIQNGTNTLTGPFVSSSTLTLTQGTLVLGGNVTCTTFTSNNTNTRQIQFGTNSINTTSTGTVFNVNGTNLTYTGTPTVNISNNSATATTITTSTGFTETNALSFNITTGTYTLTESGNNVYRNMNYTGFAGTVTGINSRIYFGNLTLVSGMTYTNTGTLFFFATSGTQDITSAGKTFGFVTVDGVGGTVRLQDALLTGATQTLTLTKGTFNANNQNVTVGAFVSNNSNTRTITMGSGTWTLASTGTVWNLATTTGLTFNRDTANIVLSSTGGAGRTFAGGGLTYNNLTIGGTTGTSTLTITGNNTFGTIASTKTVAHTITLPASGTTTVSNWTVSGTAGNVVTLNSSSAGTQSTLTKTGGGVISGIDYLSIQDSAATPSTTWYAGANSTDVSNNTGWIFSAYSPSNGNFFFLFN